MTKFEALKMVPVERFADLFYDMAHNAKDSEEFKQILLSEFPQDSIPALQKCSTGEDLVSDNAFLEDSNNSHHKVQKACICIAIHLDSFRQQDMKNKIADFGEPCLLCPYAGDCNLDWLSVMEPVLSKALGIINVAEAPDHEGGRRGDGGGDLSSAFGYKRRTPSYSE